VVGLGDERHRLGPFSGRLHGARGHGQSITVFPGLHLLVAHKAAPADGNVRTRQVTDAPYQTVRMHVVAA
jgi:hypothetical protein